MTESDFTVILRTVDVTSAELLKAVLEEEGIPSMLENEHQAGLAGAIPVRLFVKKQDEKRAHEILAEHERVDEEE